MTEERKVIVIVGPTGSGKTDAAIEIAKEIEQGKIGGFLGAEIIAADSRTIYRGMDIGTAKPSIEERQGVAHYGFDVADVDERFTVTDWKTLAEEKICEIIGRGKLPMIVGGTGFYVDALVYDYKFEVPGKGYGRERGECIKNVNNAGGKIVQQEIERNPDRQKMCSKYRMFGVRVEREELRARLKKRVEGMLENFGLGKETQRLVERYGLEMIKTRGDIYGICWKWMNGEPWD